MRKTIMTLILCSLTTAALAAPTSRASPAVAAAQQAIAAAGPNATDAQVQAAYPRFMLHPDHPPETWFVASTDSGCLYFNHVFMWDSAPPNKVLAKVAAWKRDHFNVKWTGSPCTKGQLISGAGTLSWGDMNTRNTVGSKRADGFEKWTGTMVEGVFVGVVHRVYSRDEAATIFQTFELFGGCFNNNPADEGRKSQMCQPRVP
ncbi:MAG: hypothetical protein QFC78_11130 [Pseudomonadota bacterium]|nr:hypothetical protein [Pseudomonadota bacterium]